MRQWQRTKAGSIPVWKATKKVSFISSGRQTCAPIWCSQYITRRGRDRDLLGVLVSKPGNVKDIFSTTVQTGTGPHTASYAIDTVALSQGWNGWGVALTTHTYLAPGSRIHRAVPLLSLCASHDSLRGDSYCTCDRKIPLGARHSAIWEFFFTVVSWSCLELKLVVLRELLMQEKSQTLGNKPRLKVSLSGFVTFQFLMLPRDVIVSCDMQTSWQFQNK